MWENFVISERKKKLEYDGIWKNCWFWRTKQQREIDYLEEGDGCLNGCEIKWNPKAKVKSKGVNFYSQNPQKIYTIPQ